VYLVKLNNANSGGKHTLSFVVTKAKARSFKRI
ncbi:MAG: hypothetical protein ACD_22C00251G0006, partial [uncultured bacterium]